MLKAIISHNEQTAIVELPMDRLSLQYELSQIGIRKLAKDIPILDEEDQPISVKLFSESDIGQKLADRPIRWRTPMCVRTLWYTPDRRCGMRSSRASPVGSVTRRRQFWQTSRR